MTDAHELGRAGEDTAAAWYQRGGYVVLDRNFRVAAGEIDLVLARRAMVIFCEVKTRSSDRFGVGAEAVGYRKQQRIRAVALVWLRQDERRWSEIRFDVASLQRHAHGFSVEVIEAAF